MDFNKPFGERMEDNNNNDNYDDNNENSGEPQKDFFESIKESFTNIFNDLKSKDVSASANEFMESNTIVTKFVFLVFAQKDNINEHKRGQRSQKPPKNSRKIGQNVTHNPNSKTVCQKSVLFGVYWSVKSTFSNNITSACL